MEEIVFYYPEGHQAHYEMGHPERPERVEVILQALKKGGWWEKYPQVEPLVLSKEVMEGIHTADYLEFLASSCQRGAHLDMDTYTTTASWDLAMRAAGGAAAIAQAVWEGSSKRGLALTRPPGHHATPSRGMGFCLLNNIAIAAEHLLSFEDSKPTRLAIVDLDWLYE